MAFRLLASVLVFAGVLFGQAATGVLTGIVNDSSGAVVPGAKVLATNQSNRITWTTETSTTGSYLFPNLAPADYRVSVEAQGFKRGSCPASASMPAPRSLNRCSSSWGR